MVFAFLASTLIYKSTVKKMIYTIFNRIHWSGVAYYWHTQLAMLLLFFLLLPLLEHCRYGFDTTNFSNDSYCVCICSTSSTNANACTCRASFHSASSHHGSIQWGTSFSHRACHPFCFFSILMLWTIEFLPVVPSFLAAGFTRCWIGFSQWQWWCECVFVEQTIQQKPEHQTFLL